MGRNNVVSGGGERKQLLEGAMEGVIGGGEEMQFL